MLPIIWRKKQYVSSILNLINRWGGGSRSENVGQVSELIKQFRSSQPNGKIEDWVQFHKELEGKDIEVLQKGKNKKRVIVKMAGIQQGIDDNFKMLSEVRKVLNQLTKNDIEIWLRNLTFEKTFCGLLAQDYILNDIAKGLGEGYTCQLGNMEDEKKGIDGFIFSPDKEKAYAIQIKSNSYKELNAQERFDCTMVFYNLTKDGLNYTFDADEMRKNEYIEK